MTTTPWPKAIGFFQSTALPMVSSASVRCVVCTVSWAPWLRFTGVHALCVVLYVRRLGPPGSCSPVRVLAVCSSHVSYPPPSSWLVLVHALRDCPPAFSCRRLLVLVAPLAFAFESPSVLGCSFGLPSPSFPWLVSSLSSLPTSPCSCLSFPPSCPPRSGPSSPGSMCPRAHVPICLPIFSFSPLALSPPASRLLSLLPPPSVPCSCSCSPVHVAPPPSSSPCLLPRTFQSRAASSPVVPVRAHCVPGCSSSLHRVHPRTFCRIPSAAPDARVHGTGFTPGRSSPGARPALHSAPYAPIRGVFLSYSFRCLGRSIPSDDPVRGLVPCFVPSRMLHSGALFNRILSFALDAPVRSTGFSPGRSSPGARAVLHSAPDAPLLGVSFVVFSPLPRTLQSVALGSLPDDSVRGLLPCIFPPRMLPSGPFFYRILSVASDAPVRGTGFTPRRFSLGAIAVLHAAPDAPIWGFFLS